jgi:hypothetical protein
MKVQRKFTWRPTSEKVDTTDLSDLCQLTLNPALHTSSNDDQGVIHPCNLYLDQGDEPSCTGFAMAHYLATRPALSEKQVTAPMARYLYQLAKTFDQWPGEDYEGSSIVGVVRAAMSLGYIDHVTYISNADDFFYVLRYEDAALVGSSWYSGMMEPDSSNSIHVSGDVLGGHAYLTNIISKKSGKGVMIHQSWGVSWGLFGKAWISFDDVYRLFETPIEVALPHKKHT